MTRRGPVAAKGFGLIEMIVAFAIMATTGLALFDWLNQSLATASRLKRIEDEARLSLNAQALLSNVNAMTQPEGERAQSQVKVRWTAERIAPVLDGPVGAEGQAQGLWQVGLFKLHVHAADAHSGAAIELDLVQVGYQAKPNAIGETEDLRARR